MLSINAPAVRPRLVTPAFATVMLAGVGYFFADGVLIPAVPLYVSGPLASSDAGVGIAFGAFTLSALVLRPWAGRLADQRGRRLAMIAGAAVFAVSVLGYAAADSLPVLVGLRLLTGVGEALFFVGLMAAVGDLAPPERRGEAMSWASLSLYVGLALGPPVGEWLVNSRGYVTTWLVAAGAAFGAVLLALRVAETRTPDESPPGPAVARRLIHRGTLVPAGLLLTVVWGMAGLLTFAPLYARDLGLPDSGWLLFGFAGIVVLIRSVGARLPDRLGASRATIAALTLAVAGLATIGLWRTAPGLVAGAAVLAVGVALATPAIMMLALEGTPANERGAVSGTIGMSLDLALGLGPITLGLVAAVTGRGSAFLAAAGVAALGLALAVASAHHRA
ncbi:MAG: MFS transporter, partial [Micromonosporaceae bacterium]